MHLEGKAGDAFIFGHSIWHGPAPNNSGRARRTLLYNYSQLFMRAYDYDGIHPLAAVPNVATSASTRVRVVATMAAIWPRP